MAAGPAGFCPGSYLAAGPDAGSQFAGGAGAPDGHRDADGQRTAWAGLVGGLSAPDCQACTNYAGEAERLIAAHERFASPPLAVESVRVLRRTSDGYEISAAVEQQATRVYNLDGSLARDQAREELTMLVETRWTATGWQVLSVRKT